MDTWNTTVARRVAYPIQLTRKASLWLAVLGWEALEQSVDEAR